MIAGLSVHILAKSLPVKGRAEALRTEFNKSLLESFLYLLEACKEAVPEGTYLLAHKKLSSLSPQDKLSALLNIAHLDFYKAVEDEHIDRINEVAKRLAEDEFQISGIQFVNYDSLDTYYAQMLRPTFGLHNTNTAKFSRLSGKMLEDVSLSFSRGFAVFQTLFPDIWEEMNTFMSEILVFNATTYRYGSSSDVFGMIFMCYCDVWQKLTDVLDILAHEEAHLYLHCLNIHDAFVHNAEEYHLAPLRKTKRPLTGIYHAVFVLARIIYVLEHSLAAGVIPKEERDHCKEKIAYYRARHKAGQGVIDEHAKLTDLGSGILDSSQKLVA